MTITLGFAAGFAVARSGPSNSTDSAAPTPTAAPTTGEPPGSIESATTSTAEVSTTTLAVTTTESSTTTVLPSTTVTTTPTPTPSVTLGPPPTTAMRPADLAVEYPRDAAGRLVLPLGGSASLVIRNSGGSVGQWLLSGSGFVSANGMTRGQLAPGEQVVAAVGPAPGSTSGTTGVLNVLGVGPSGATAIPTIVG